jgi:glucose/arabinose dehydrogenase
MERRVELTLLSWVLLFFSCLAYAGLPSVAPLPADPATVLHLPPGFQVNVFARLPPGGADYFKGPRFMTTGPDGNIYLSLGSDNKVVMLPNRNHSGQADEIITVADQLNAPQGLAFVDGKLLVANQDGVVKIDNGSAQPFITNLPTGGHTMKSLKLGPDGFLYMNVGSSCNVCTETDPTRATIQRYTKDGEPAGKNGAVWATGLRNSQGFAWQPDTHAMYATNDGADMRSNKKNGQPNDDIPPEHLNKIKAGADYGWPYCWGNRQLDPNFADPSGVCRNMQIPSFLLPAHSTPIGITFIDNANFPANYQGDALIALHGSWNRATPSGYKVVRVKFKNGKPVGVSDFATGWLEDHTAWGRPVDVMFGPDKALYISDDRSGIIFRIVYSGVRK